METHRLLPLPTPITLVLSPSPIERGLRALLPADQALAGTTPLALTGIAAGAVLLQCIISARADGGGDHA